MTTKKRSKPRPIRKQQKIRLVDVEINAPSGRDLDKLVLIHKVVDGYTKALDAMKHLQSGTVVNLNGNVDVGNNLTISGNGESNFGDSTVTLRTVGEDDS